MLSPPGPAGRHTRLCEPRTSALQLVSSVTLGGSLGRRPHVRHAVCAGFLWRLGAHGMLPRSEAGDTRQAQPRDSVLAEGGEPAVQLWATGLQARSYKPYRPPAPSTRDPRSHRAGHERGEERRAWAGGRRAAGREKTCRLGTSLLPQAERRGCSQAPAGGTTSKGPQGRGPRGRGPALPRAPFPEAPPHTLRFPEAPPPTSQSPWPRPHALCFPPPRPLGLPQDRGPLSCGRGAPQTSRLWGRHPGAVRVEGASEHPRVCSPLPSPGDRPLEPRGGTGSGPTRP